jgi:hypothetical protein
VRQFLDGRVQEISVDPEVGTSDIMHRASSGRLKADSLTFMDRH